MSLASHVLVDLCGLTFGTQVPTVDDCEWLITGIDGWDSAAVESSTASPTGRSGSVQLSQRFGGRELIVSGSVFASTQDDARTAWNRVVGEMPGLGASGVLVVHEDPAPTWVEVRQNGRHSVPSPVNGHFDFILSLIALSPHRLALTPKTVTVAAGATVTLTNDGTATAYLTATATGSGTVQLRQDTSGQVLRSKASVASGTVFDSGLRQVRSSGGVVLTGVVDNPSEWLSIPRLASTSVTNQGTAPLSVTFYDSYA